VDDFEWKVTGEEYVADEILVFERGRRDVVPDIAWRRCVLHLG